MPKIGNNPTDPRRLAFLLLIPGIAWAMHYSYPEESAGFWMVGGCLLALVVMLLPLPPWQEEAQRRWLVVLIYGGLSALVAVAGAVLHSLSA